jgi:multiple sugar transport system permease protein
MSTRDLPAVVKTPASRRSDALSGFLFALPHLVLFATFVLAPVLYGLYISLHRWHILAKEHPLIGLSNYGAALSDDIFWIALRNTVYFVVLVVPLGNLVSLLLALALASVRRLGTFYKIVYYLPVVISIAVVAVLWRWMYNTEIGLINLYLGTVVGGLRNIGLPLRPLNRCRGCPILRGLCRPSRFSPCGGRRAATWCCIWRV